MKPRFTFEHGVWYCVGNGAWGAGRTSKSAWKSWLWDESAGSKI